MRVNSGGYRNRRVKFGDDGDEDSVGSASVGGASAVSIGSGGSNSTNTHIRQEEQRRVTEAREKRGLRRISTQVQRHIPPSKVTIAQTTARVEEDAEHIRCIFSPESDLLGDGDAAPPALARSGEEVFQHLRKPFPANVIFEVSAEYKINAVKLHNDRYFSHCAKEVVFFHAQKLEGPWKFASAPHFFQPKHFSELHVPVTCPTRFIRMDVVHNFGHSTKVRLPLFTFIGVAQRPRLLTKMSSGRVEMVATNRQAHNLANDRDYFYQRVKELSPFRWPAFVKGNGGRGMAFADGANTGAPENHGRFAHTSKDGPATEDDEMEFSAVEGQLSPRSKYIRRCNERRVLPTTLGFMHHARHGRELNLSRFLIGDKIAESLALGGLSVDTLNALVQVNLSENRLSDAAEAMLLRSILGEAHALEDLDLSDNMGGTLTAEALSSGLQGNAVLTKLNLKNNRLGETHLNDFVGAVSDLHGLHYLNLSGNRITGLDNCRCIARLIERSSGITSLDLSWNELVEEIKGLGQAIERNQCLEILDLSNNRLGNSVHFDNPEEDEEPWKLFSEGLSNSKSLQHVDLSHNQLGLPMSLVLGNHLKHNHRIVGLHMFGNDCRVTSLGYVLPRSHGHRSYMVSGIALPPELVIKHADVCSWHYDKSRNCGSDCCLCAGGVQYTFEFAMASHDTALTKVCLHLDVDEYDPFPMVLLGNGSYISKRIIPPGLRFFFFSGETADGEVEYVCAQDQRSMDVESVSPFTNYDDPIEMQYP
mmetsp:Transcript_37898/g.118794  ORF Transcript_37898/g.118794 Transcript_37898/m.118794 type:complete len:761 (-) Transcript_37898:39-2321(-)